LNWRRRHSRNKQAYLIKGKGKMAGQPQKHDRKKCNRRRNGQRGQSLAELAISLPFLIITLSGIVDLGRAFFTRITLETAVSEGAHYMAAYPGCVYYGAAFGEGGNVINLPSQCAGTNSITGRMKNESNLLLPANIVSTSLNPPTGKRMDQVVPGDIVDVSITYKMTLLTPFISSIFGNWMSLTVDGQETVRGTGVPDTTGLGTTYVPTNTTIPMVTNIQQLTTTSFTPQSAACYGNTTRPDPSNYAYPYLRWVEPTAGSGQTQPDGFEIWTADAGLGNNNPSAHTIQIANVLKSGAGTVHYTDTSVNTVGSTTPPHIDLTVGGSQLYAVRPYTLNGSTKTYGDWEYILTTCPQAKPAFNGAGFQCGTGTPATSIIFYWAMPLQQYSWQTDASGSPWSQPVAWQIDHYTLYGLNPNTNQYQAVVSTGAGSKDLTSYTWDISSLVYNDWRRTTTYFIAAMDSSGNQVGVDDDGTTNSSGVAAHTTTPADIVVGCS
jgi:hypothetical protein